MFRSAPFLIPCNAVAGEAPSKFVVHTKALDRCCNFFDVQRVTDFDSIDALLDRLSRTRRSRTKRRNSSRSRLEIDQSVALGVSPSLLPWNHRKEVSASPSSLELRPLHPTMK